MGALRRFRFTSTVLVAIDVSQHRFRNMLDTLLLRTRISDRKQNVFKKSPETINAAKTVSRETSSTKYSRLVKIRLFQCTKPMYTTNYFEYVSAVKTKTPVRRPLKSISIQLITPNVHQNTFNYRLKQILFTQKNLSSRWISNDKFQRIIRIMTSS